MIARMSKYNFVLFAAQSEDFVEKLRGLGLVDITTAGWEPSEEDRQLRVTLLVGDEEKTEYEGTLAAGEQSVMLIPISAAEEGEMTCRVYLNGELFSEETVLLY